MQGELDLVLRKIKNRKAAGFDEIPLDLWKTREFDNILLRHCNAYITKTQLADGQRDGSSPFPKKGDLRIAKNYWGIILMSLAAKIYNVLLCNLIEPKIEKKLRKNENGFRRNWSTTSQF